ncbi:hypothetical protein ACFOGG_16095 [Brenneria rubrifaciens]|uniref:hypothetical protein n=1 Tax=Brenneria rubrifaciens TaxID=55213 RepID=UPI0036136197
MRRRCPPRLTRVTWRTVWSCSTAGTLLGNRKSESQVGCGLACQVATQAGATAIAGVAEIAPPAATAKVSMAEAEALESDFMGFPF